MRTRILTLLTPMTLLIPALVSLSGCQKAHLESDSQSTDLIAVKIAAVKEQLVTEQVELSGTVIAQPNRSARVTAPVQGVLSYVGPHVGDWVAKGEVVAKLEDSIQRAQLHQNSAAYSLAEANLSKAQHGSRPQEIEQAKAALDVARANALNAQQNKNRLQKLYEQEISAGRDYDLAVSQESVALSQLKSAEANLSMVLKGPRPEDRDIAKAQADQAAGSLEQSQASLVLTQLKSPFKGVVAERYLDVGEQAGPANPVLLVVDPSTVNVLANLPVGYNEKFAAGQVVEITVPDNAVSLTGHIVRIGMKLDPVTNTVPVQIEVPNAQLRLKFGMVVQAKIAIDKHMALVVPKESLIGSADNPNRQVVNFISGVDSNDESKKQSKPVAVQTGIVDGGMVEIKSGLKANDTVATNVNYELPEGTQVTVK